MVEMRKLPLTPTDVELIAKLEKDHIARWGDLPGVSVPGGRLPPNTGTFEIFMHILSEAPACHGFTRYIDGVILWVGM